MTAESERRVNAFEFRCFRKLLKISYTEHRTNQSVQDEIIKAIGPYERLLTVIKSSEMSQYGQINRAKESLAYLVLQGAAEERRGRGRPRTA